MIKWRKLTVKQTELAIINAAQVTSVLDMISIEIQNIKNVLRFTQVVGTCKY